MGDPDSTMALLQSPLPSVDKQDEDDDLLHVAGSPSSEEEGEIFFKGQQPPERVAKLSARPTLSRAELSPLKRRSFEKDRGATAFTWRDRRTDFSVEAPPEKENSVEVPSESEEKLSPPAALPTSGEDLLKPFKELDMNAELVAQASPNLESSVKVTPSLNPTSTKFKTPIGRVTPMSQPGSAGYRTPIPKGKYLTPLHSNPRRNHVTPSYLRPTSASKHRASPRKDPITNKTLDITMCQKHSHSGPAPVERFHRKLPLPYDLDKIVSPVSKYIHENPVRQVRPLSAHKPHITPMKSRGTHDKI